MEHTVANQRIFDCGEGDLRTEDVKGRPKATLEGERVLFVIFTLERIL